MGLEVLTADSTRPRQSLLVAALEWSRMRFAPVSRRASGRTEAGSSAGSDIPPAALVTFTLIRLARLPLLSSSLFPLTVVPGFPASRPMPLEVFAASKRLEVLECVVRLVLIPMVDFNARGNWAMRCRVDCPMEEFAATIAVVSPVEPPTPTTPDDTWLNAISHTISVSPYDSEAKGTKPFPSAQIG